MKANPYQMTWSRFERLHICIAAKDRSQGPEPPTFLSNIVREAESYDISAFLQDKIMMQFVLKCPTSPQMYVYFKDLQINKRCASITGQKK